MKKFIVIIFLFSCSIGINLVSAGECYQHGWEIKHQKTPQIEWYEIRYCARTLPSGYGYTELCYYLCQYNYNSISKTWTQFYFNGSPFFSVQWGLIPYWAVWDGNITTLLASCEHTQLQSDEANAIKNLSLDSYLLVMLNAMLPNGPGAEGEEFLSIVEKNDPSKVPDKAYAETEENVAKGAEPVHLSNGEFGYSVTDLVITDRGLPIEITRSYGTKREYNSRFGYGWDLNYNMKVRQVLGDDELVLLDGKGCRRIYNRQYDGQSPTNTFSRSADRSDYFVLDEGCEESRYVLIDKKNGIEHHFKSNGNLANVKDRNGNAITFTYTGPDFIKGYSRFFGDNDEGGPTAKRDIVAKEYKLVKIESSLGRQIQLDYYSSGDPDGGEGLLKTITDLGADPSNPADNRAWTYKYDLQYNNLISVTGTGVDDPENPGLTYYPVTTYVYDDPVYPQCLTKIYDQQNSPPAGGSKAYLQNTYNFPDSSVDTQVYGEQTAKYGFICDSDNNRTILKNRETVQDNQNNTYSKSQTITVYTDSGQTLSETVATSHLSEKPNAWITEYEYNEYNEVIRAIMPRRNCIDYQHDSRGNVTKVTNRPECDVLPFNGSSDYVSITDNDDKYAFGGTGNDFAIAFRVKRQRTNQLEYLLDRRDTNGYGWSLVFQADNTLQLRMVGDGVNSAITSTSTVADSNWHYVVVSVNRASSNSNASIFIDGSLAQGTTSIGQPVIASWATLLYVGCSYNGVDTRGNFFQGSLDELMIFNKALLTRDDTFGLSIYSQGLIGYWKMDDNGANATVADSSASDKDGTAAKNTEDMVDDGKVPGEIVTQYTYVQHNDFDFIRTVTDPQGRHVTYRYDFDANSAKPGNMTEMYIPGVEYFQRSTGGALTSAISKDYGETGAVPMAYFTYNDYGQIDTITTADGLVTKNIYYPDNDAQPQRRGRLHQLIIDYGDSSHKNITTEYDYDTMGHVNKTTQDASGLNVSVEMLYNALDQLVQLTSPILTGQTEGYKTKFDYTKNGKLWRTKHDFTDGSSNTQTQQVEYGYNLLDAITLVRDSLGYETKSSYDDDENVVSVQDAKLALTSMEYDERDLLWKIIDAENDPFDPLYWTEYKYDANGNLIQIAAGKTDTDAGQVTTYSYDGYDHLIKTTYPDGSTETADYDLNSNIILSKTRKGDLWCYEYDAVNRLISRQQIMDDALGEMTESTGTWSPVAGVNGAFYKGAVSSSTSGDTFTFKSTINGTCTVSLRWLASAGSADVAVAILDGTTSLYTGTVNQTANSGQWNQIGTTSFTFAGQARVIITVPSGGSACADALRFTTTDFYHDIAGRTLLVDKDGSQTGYYYDTIGRLEKTTDQNSRDVQYQYDNLGRRTRLIYPDGSHITYHYDAMSRLTDIKDSSSNVIAHYDYDELSRRTAMYYNYDGDTSYNETDVDGVIRYDYQDKAANPQTENNLGNRLEAVIHDIDNDGTGDLTFAYTYDAVGNRTQMTVDSSNTHSYDYDNIYQLKEDSTTNNKYNWVYDALGNWDYVNLNDSLSKQFSIASGNLLNQYTWVDGAYYTYDANGNLTYDGTNTYVYDAENHLLAVKYHTETIASYTYDTFGRRSSTSYAPAATYVYDGEHIIAEYNGYGALSRKYIYGPGIDEPICMIVPAGTTEVRYFYHQDALGSIVALSKFNSTTGHAEIVEGYSYDAFGRVGVNCSAGDDGNWLTGDNGTIRNTSNTSAYGNRFMYAGREYEGCIIGLYYYRARFYKPDIGRFLQPDPIGYDDGPNMYAYCGNNPINFVDPSGLCKNDLAESLGGFGAGFFGSLGQLGKGWYNFFYGFGADPKRQWENIGNWTINSLAGVYGFETMVYNSLYDIGANPGIVYSTLYDFGYHSDEILLNEFGNKSAYEMGYAVGQTTMGAEIGVVTANAGKILNRYSISAGIKTANTRGPWIRITKDGKDILGVDWGKFKLNGKTVNRPHLHYGSTKSQFKKHRPWQN